MQNLSHSQRHPSGLYSRVPPDAENCIKLGHIQIGFHSGLSSSTDLQQLIAGGFVTFWPLQWLQCTLIRPQQVLSLISDVCLDAGADLFVITFKLVPYLENKVHHCSLSVWVYGESTKWWTAVCNVSTINIIDYFIFFFVRQPKIFQPNTKGAVTHNLKVRNASSEAVFCGLIKQCCVQYFDV